MRQDILELINRRERQILVHSFLYYQLNESIISDHTFDLWSKELVELKEQYPEEFTQSVYAKEFADFDGSSGYDLPYSYPAVQSTGYKLLRIHKERQRK
jgi:NAD-dependent DNA ligase